MDRGAWPTTVPGVAELDTTDHACTSTKGGYGESCGGGTEAIEDSDAGKDWRQKENRVTEEEMDGITDSMDMNLGRLWEMGRDRAAWRAPVHGVAKSQTWLGDWTTTTLIVFFTFMVWKGKPLNQLEIPFGQSITNCSSITSMKWILWILTHRLVLHKMWAYVYCRAWRNKRLCIYILSL